MPCLQAQCLMWSSVTAIPMKVIAVPMSSAPAICTCMDP